MSSTRVQGWLSRSWIAVLSAMLAVALAGTGATAGAAPRQDLAPGVPAAEVPDGATAGKLGKRIARTEGKVTAFIELDRTAGADAFAERHRAGAGKGAARRAANAAISEVRSVLGTVIGTLRARDSATRVLARTVNAVPGAVVRADSAKIRELAGRADVRSVRAVVPKERTNASAAQLTKTMKAWQRTGRFGDDVRIGIIDDGVDYTHADFGGPGTKEAYESIDPTKVEASYFPTAKVVGGTDLVGDDYDASGDNGSPVPDPDPNPISCGQHGTHVAGTAGGFGVNADGSTFDGDYAELDGDKLNRMRIGPGTAPKSLLYAIKVFGCHGSTDATAQAMDWALDPDGDGDYTDRLDLINMSLGQTYGAPDDPDSLFVRKLAQHGVLTVNAAGNSGNLYDVAGSPGNTPEALTVASSRDSYVLRDAAEVTAPTGVGGTKPGQYSQNYEGYDELDRTRPVVPLADQDDGCQAFSDRDATAVRDKFVWLEWDDNDSTRACGSSARTDNATEAGAAGVVLSSSLDHFAAGIAGNSEIPVFQLTASVTDELRPALRAGTLEMRLAGPLRASMKTYDRSIADTTSSFTSRGVRAPAVKPDVAAPGDTLASARSGSGNGAISMSGTSMASPHAAGISALVRQAHPDWRPEEVKAAVMNTATADVRHEPGDQAPVEAPQRVGAGRVNAEAAVSNRVLAMVAEDPGSVSVSFGTIEAGSPLTKSKTIKLVNKSARTVELRASYRSITRMPGVRYELSTDRVTLNPRGVAEVRVTVRIDDPAALRKAADPTIDKTQIGLARQFLADASGRVEFTPVNGTTSPLRVPVYSAPKPTAAIGTPKTVGVPGGSDQAVLNLDGRGVDQGEGDRAYRSMISMLQLGARSPRLPECTEHVTTECTINGTAESGDLRYVGAATTAPLAVRQGKPETAMLAFGMATWSDWANVGSNTSPFVDIDVDGDGKPDYESYVTRPAGTDVLVVNTVDLNAEGTPSVDVQPVNGQLGDVDTNVFDSNVLVLPVSLDALGIDAAEAEQAPISYTAGVTGFYSAPGTESAIIDEVSEPVSFDPLKPGMWVQGGGEPALSYLAEPGTALVVNYDHQAARRQDARELLALHQHNASGERVDVVRVKRGAAPDRPDRPDRPERPERPERENPGRASDQG